MQGNVRITDLGKAVVGGQVIRQKTHGRGQHSWRSYEEVTVSNVQEGQYGVDKVRVNKERTAYNWTGWPVGKAQGKLLPFPEDAPDDYVATLNAEQEVERQRIAAEKQARREEAEHKALEARGQAEDLLADDLEAMRKVPTRNGVLHIVDSMLTRWGEELPTTLVVRKVRERESWDGVQVEWSVESIRSDGTSSTTAWTGTRSTAADVMVQYVADWFI